MVTKSCNKNTFKLRITSNAFRVKLGQKYTCSDQEQEKPITNQSLKGTIEALILSDTDA